jgi:tetratricopeptide (TPR) repeat protein
MLKSISTITVAAAIAAGALAYTLAFTGKQATPQTKESFTQASSAIAEGKFDDAIGRLTEIVDAGEPSASTLYNLGIAHHRAGDLGQAILNYERAAALEPHAADIRANLERARKDSATIEAPAPSQLRAANLLSPRAWTAVGASGFLALGLLALGRATCRLDWPKPALRAAAAAAIIATAAPLAALAIQARGASGRVIVTADGASLRVSPFDASKSVTSLTPGRSLRLLPDEPHGSYHLARLESGQSGWVEAGEFTAVHSITAK